MMNENISHMNLYVRRMLTLRELKESHLVGNVQFHRLHGDKISPDPFHGLNDEWDRFVAAMTELHYLDQHVRDQAQAIFEKHGLTNHGFACTVDFHYVRDWDRSEEIPEFD